jgi:hypothetical protein
MGDVVNLEPLHLARFPAGMRVIHITQGPGTVHAHIEGNVVVRFDKIKEGKHVVGAYDAVWFKKYPRFLMAHGDAPNGAA